MNHGIIEAKVKDILSEFVHPDNQKNIKAETHLEALGLDSLDKAGIIMKIEDDLNLEITDEEAAAFVTVGDVQKFLEKVAA